MKRLSLALALCLAPSLAFGQCTGVFPANTLCGNLSATAQPPRAFPSAGTIVGPGSSTLNGLPTWGNTSGTLLADGNGKSIPGNYTFLSALTLGSAGTLGVSGTANFGASSFKVNNQTFTFPAAATTIGGLGTTQTWTGTNTFTGPINLSATTVVSGTSFFGGSARFGGQPWFDVKAGVHGCAPAAGNAVTDDTAAIQCAITYISNTSGGGIVFFPPGTYVTTSTITVPRGVTIAGSGVGATTIGTNVDATVFNYTGSYGGLRDIFVAGYQNSAATLPAITTSAGIIQLTFRDCNIWGGLWALKIAATDSLIDDCYLAGNGSAGGNLYINGGANWYRRVKADPSVAVSYGVYIDQGSLGGTVQENAFDMLDVSPAGGSFINAAVVISNTNAWTQFTNSTFANQVILSFHTFTAFSTSKFGSFISTTANKTAIVASRGLTSISATNASCSSNFNITC